MLVCAVQLCAALTAAAAPGGEAQRYDAAFAAGVLHFNHGEYERAEERFRAALRARPGDLDARYFLADSLLLQQRYDEAEGVLRGVLAARPNWGAAVRGLGIAAYHQGRDAEAEELLTRAERLLPSDPVPPFFRALALRRLGRHAEADAELSRAMVLDPAVAPEGHFERGIAHYRRGILDEARVELAAAAAADPDSVLAESARRYLRQIREETMPLAPFDARRPFSPSRWDLHLLTSIQYDSNVVLLPLGVQPPGGPTGISRRDDVRTVLSARGEYRVVQSPSWTVGAGYGFYQSFHSTLSGFDTQTHTPSLYIQHRAGRVQTRVDYLYDYVSVGRSPFLVSHALRPVVTVRGSDRLFTQFYAGYQHKDFQHGRFLFNSTRDGTNWLAGVMQFVHFPNRAALVRFGYTFDTDRTGGVTPAVAVPGRTTHADWSYIGHRFSIGTILPAVLTLTPELTFDYYHQSYDAPNSFSASGQTVRVDDIYIIAVALSRRLTERLTVSVGYSYTRDKANIPLFDYERSIASVSLTGTF